jgi:Fur family ferric uptake transcriptional regulator
MHSLEGPTVGLRRPVPRRQAVTEAFRAYLREHNLPITAQRLAIADVLTESSRHLSADEIIRELTTRRLRVGTATVYRTLELLVKSGLVVERDFGEGFRRYEPARDAPHHEHLICARCGTVREFRDERLERMTTLLAEAHGYVRLSHRLVIHGTCDDCRQRGGGRPIYAPARGRSAPV